MDTVLLIKFAAAFGFVIGLMMLLSYTLKKMGLSAPMGVNVGKRRLKVVEFLQIDQRRRLVLIRRDDREHLLVLGPQGETVIESNIPAEADNVVGFTAKEQKNVQA